MIEQIHIIGTHSTKIYPEYIVQKENYYEYERYTILSDVIKRQGEDYYLIPVIVQEIVHPNDKESLVIDDKEDLIIEQLERSLYKEAIQILKKYKIDPNYKKLQ